MQPIRFLLSPLSLLYGLGTEVRNMLYDKGLSRSFSFTIPVIAVGNLTVGGTGKTPMIEYLINKLAPKHKVFTLSRGYKRKTRGFRLARPDDHAATIGDEPFQIYRKFGDSAGVAVGEDRALAITEIIARAPETDIILMDDAFQHRKVRPDVNILLTDFNRPFYRDFLLPLGNLRERRHHAGRADAVVVTKCPRELEKSKMDDIENSVKQYVHNNIPVYFTSIKYLELKPVFNRETRCINKVFVFSGIAATLPFLNYMEKKYQMAGHATFPDHFEFTEEVILKRILKPYSELHDREVAMVCTEKDAVRFIGDPGKTKLMKELPLYYLPVEVSFLRGEREFLSMISKTIEDTRGNKNSSD